MANAKAPAPASAPATAATPTTRATAILPVDKDGHAIYPGIADFPHDPVRCVPRIRHNARYMDLALLVWQQAGKPAPAAGKVRPTCGQARCVAIGHLATVATPARANARPVCVCACGCGARKAPTVPTVAGATVAKTA